MSYVTTIQSKSGYKYPVTKIGDRNYFVLNIVKDIRQRQLDIRATAVRPDDIFVGGVTKSGNTWAYELVSMVMNQTKEVSKEIMYHRSLELAASSNFEETVRSWPSPRMIFYHGRLTSEMPADIIETKPKIVYVLRNPKDVLVSSFNFYQACQKSLQFKGTWEDFLEMNLAEEFPPDSWFNHVLDTEKFMTENPEIPFHLLVYEKMKEDLEGEVKQLCQFLGKPTHMAKEIADAGEFKKFKPAMEKIKFDEIEKRRFCENSNFKFFRKGIIGDWKNVFTVAQSEAVDQLFEAKMSESKLARHVQPYM